jgi:hypothetical protein
MTSGARFIIGIGSGRLFIRKKRKPHSITPPGRSLRELQRLVAWYRCET